MIGILGAVDGVPSIDIALGIGRWSSWAGFALMLGLLIVGDPRRVVGDPGHVADLAGDEATATARSESAQLTRLRTTWLVAATVSLVGSFAVFLLGAVSAARGDWSDAFDVRLISDALDGLDGRAAAARVVLLAVVAGLGVGAVARTHLAGKSWWANAVALSVIGCALASVVGGHAADASAPVIAVSLAVVHTISIGAWFGGIVVVLLLAAGRHDVSSLVNRFSTIAGLLVPAALVSGPALAWLVTGGPSAIGDDAYSRWLIVKVGLAIGVLVLAGATRVAWRAGNRRATTRGMVAELVVAASVLAVVSGLVSLDPDARAAEVQVVQRLVDDGMIAVVEIDDARVGATVAHFYFTPDGGSLEVVRSARAELVSADAPADGTVVDLVPSGPNHFTAVVDLPSTGRWSLAVSASAGSDADATFVATFEVLDR